MRAFATPVTRFFGRSTNRPVAISVRPPRVYVRLGSESAVPSGPALFWRVLINAQIGGPLSGVIRTLT
jgi:hypothetical protein